MTYAIFIVCFWVVSVIIYSYISYKRDISHKVWFIAYQMYRDNCKMYGYPKKKGKYEMTYWELAEYFDNSDKCKIYTSHVRRNMHLMKDMHFTYRNK